MDNFQRRDKTASYRVLHTLIVSGEYLEGANETVCQLRIMRTPKVLTLGNIIILKKTCYYFMVFITFLYNIFIHFMVLLTKHFYGITTYYTTFLYIFIVLLSFYTFFIWFYLQHFYSITAFSYIFMDLLSTFLWFYKISIQRFYTIFMVLLTTFL